MRSCLKGLLCLGFLCANPLTAVAADIPVSGRVSTTTAWTTGNTYLVTGDLFIDAGVTLTVQPGVTVLFGDNVGLWVDGVLDARGTAAAGITFTGSTQAVDWWRAIFVQYAGSATFEYCTITHGGYWDNVIIRKSGSGSFTLSHSTVGYSDDIGLQILGNTGLLSLGNNIYRDNQRGAWIGINSSYDDTTSDFIDNRSYDVYLEGGTMSRDVTWSLNKEYSLLLSGDFIIGAGTTLTITPGTVVKFGQYKGLWVDGTLDARGTASEKIFFTDLRDDTVGGDANKDGPASAPGPGWWRAIFVQYAGSAVVDQGVIRHGGYNDGMNVRKTGAGNLTIRNSTVSHARVDGLTIDASAGTHTLENTTFTANAGSGLVLLNASAAVTGCTFSNNAWGMAQTVGAYIDYSANVFSGNANAAVWVGGGAMVNGVRWTRGGGTGEFALYLSESVTVAAGVTLTVDPGVTVRFGQYKGLWVDGVLDARGTSVAGITFTGGTQAVDWWRAIFVQNAGSATLEYCTLTHGGWYENVVIRKTGSGAFALRHSTVGYSDDIGLQILANTGPLALANNIYRNNRRGIWIGINTSHEDTTSDYLDNSWYDAYFEGGTTSADVTWNLKKEYSLFLSGNLSIGAGTTLTIRPGTVVKFGQYVGLWVDGTLDARGTASEKIYFTDLRDDTVGGDADKDGTTSAPGPEWWRAIFLRNAGSAVVDQSVIRYGGYYEGVNVWKGGSGSLTIRNSTVSRSRTDGLRIDGSTGTQTLENTTFTANANSGLSLFNARATVTGCTFSNNAWGMAQSVGAYIDYSANSFSGNTNASVWVDYGSMAGDVNWTRGGGTDGFALYLSGNTTIAAGVTMTVSPGVAVKFGDNVALWVDGVLDARGTAAAGITFTGSTQVPDWWRAIFVQNAGSATLEYCTVTNGGWFENVIIRKTGSGALTLKNSTVGYSDDVGLQIFNSTGQLTLANNIYRNNQRGIWIGINTSYDDNTSDFIDNSSCDAYFEGGTLTADVTWNLKKEYSVFLPGSVTIGAGATLTVKPGTVVKFGDNIPLWVDGTLDARGTASERIYFTDLRDDTVGGDANKDGTASAPSPDWWRAIFVQNAGSATLDHCTIRYGGHYENVDLHKTGSGALTMTNSTVSNSDDIGLYVGGTGAVTLRADTITANNRGVYVQSPPPELTITRNQIAGNTSSGLFNNSLVDVDARLNYWGDPSGPYNNPGNMAGKGNAVSAHVLFEPWNSTAAASHISAPMLAGTLMSGDTLYFKGRQPEDGSFRYQWTLAGGRTSSFKDPGLVSFNNPGPADTSAAVTFALIDPAGKIDPNPDTRTFTVKTATSNVPDLKTADVLAPASLNAGQSYDIDYTVTNVGDGTATGTWMDSIYGSSDQYLDDQDTLLGSASVTRNLPPGASYQGKITIRVPAVTGTFNLLACADRGWKLFERHRLNNDAPAETSVGVEELAGGATTSGSFPVNGSPQYFAVNVAAGGNLVLSFTGKVTVYLRYGAFPTLSAYDYRRHFSEGGSITVSGATPGTWYVMVVPDSAAGPIDYTVRAVVAPLVLSGVTPTSCGNAADIVLSLAGAGFQGEAAVELVNPTGTVFPAASVAVDSLSRITAVFGAGTVPAGVYDITLTVAGRSASLAAALTVTGGGEAQLVANLIIPERMGYHQVATLFVEYSNVGNVPMVAPLLILSATQNGRKGALLTLDKSLVGEGYWTSAIPKGFSLNAQILAGGKNPGVLQPGESVRVPVYYVGWLKPWDFTYPPFDFSLKAFAADDANPMDWAALEAGMRSDELDAAAWDALWAAFKSDMGDTVGQSVARLSALASYLARSGEPVRDAMALLRFELLTLQGFLPQQFANSALDASAVAPGLPLTFSRQYPVRLAQRSRTGPLGRGWSHSWDFRLAVAPDGTVTLDSAAGGRRIFQPDSRGGYFSMPGDRARLAATPSGYTLGSLDGSRMSFSTAGTLSAIQDRNDNALTFAYNGSGALSSIAHSCGKSLLISYNADGTISTVVDPYGREVTYTYSAGMLSSVRDVYGATSIYTYADTRGIPSLAAAAEANGLVRSYEFDGAGRLAVLDPGDGTGRRSFAYAGAKTTVTDLLGNTSAFHFDHRGRILKIIGPDGKAVYNTFDAAGNLTALSEPDGREFSFAYDVLGNLTGNKTPGGAQYSYAYEAGTSSVTARVDAAGHKTIARRDAKGNPLSLTLPDGRLRSFTYDAAGNLTKATNPDGSHVAYAYNAAGSPVSERTSDGVETTYAYDAYDRLISAAKGGSSTIYTYDQKGNLAGVVHAGGPAIAYTYDAAGRRTGLSDNRGNSLAYTYDSRGRYAAIRYHDTVLVTYDYDAAGRLSSIRTGDGGATTYAYNAYGKKTRQQRTNPGGTLADSFDILYDDTMRPVKITTLKGEWTYTYNPTGSQSGMSFKPLGGGPETAIHKSYDPMGLLTRVTVGGTTVAYAGDVNNRYTKSGPVSYSYDQNGNLASQDLGDGRSVSTVYDALGRPVSGANSGEAWSCSYGPEGEMNSLTVAGAEHTFVYDPDSPSTILSRYDAGGNLESFYVYGYGLAAVLKPGPGSLSVIYPAYGPVQLNGYAASEGSLAGRAAGMAMDGPPIGLDADSDFLNGLLWGGYDIQYTDPSLGYRLPGRSLSGFIPNGMTSNVEAANATAAFLRNQTVGWVSTTAGILTDDLTGVKALSWGASRGTAAVTAMAGYASYVNVQVTGVEDFTTFVSSTSGYASKFKEISGKPLAGLGMAISVVSFCDAASGLYDDAPIDTSTGMSSDQKLAYTSAGLLISGFGLASAGVITAPVWLPSVAVIATVTGVTYAVHDAVVQLWGMENFWNWWDRLDPSGETLKGDRWRRRSAGSQDPNQKLGPGGGGDNNYLNPGGAFSYRIDFENHKDALAPAQVVTVTDDFSADLDWSTFELTEVGFGDHVIPVPAGAKAFEYTERMTYNDKDLDVTVRVSLDASGRLTAWFITSDTGSGLPPEVTYGFLPPEDGTGRGQGHISYLIKPRQGLADGTGIRNIATIVFDFSTSIDTNQVDPHDKSKGTDPAKEALVTVDTSLPASAVAGLPATSSAEFTVSWHGSDPVAGIAYYSIYVRDTGGGFTSWIQTTTDTTATFQGQVGHTYGFYAIATDNAGNVEASKSEAEATTFIGTDVVEPTSSILVPADGASLMATTYRIAGTAADAGSGVDKVEISVNDGGWMVATGTTSWSFEWEVPADGSSTIRSRATDKTGNVETPGVGVTVTVYKRAPSTITVSDRQLLRAGDPFTIKGVVYTPVPVGSDPEMSAPYGDYFTSAYEGIQDRDLSLLRQMGANAVLIPSWGNTADHHAFLDKAYNSGLNAVYVIAGFRVDPGLDIDPDSPSNVRGRIKSDFLEMVETHRSHPAILFWSIGSELLAPGSHGDHLFSLIDELAAAAHAAEGGTAHPVAAALADNDLVATIGAYDGAVPNLDLWGPAVYRAGTFGTLFADYETASGKPLAILGYGSDAYDSAQGDEYENIGAPLQGDYAVGLWGEIEAHAAPSGICVGGTIAEYSDQWWRGKYGAGAGCPDADPAAQSACGQTDPAEPDGFLNEEWGGLVRIADNGSDPDLVQPREAYYALQYLWEPAGLNAVITESPQSLAHYGSVNIGLVSAEQTVSFTNSGTTNLAIGAIFIAGANTADFGTRLDGCSGRTLVPADSCTVGVVFTPTALSARSAIFSVPCSDPVRGTVTMALQGTGIDKLPPTGSVTINGGAAAIRGTSVKLTLTAVEYGGGATRMCVSNTPKCNAWVAFAKTRSWKLTAGNGKKTVYAWFRDARGNATPAAKPYKDTVIVDPIAPVNGRLRATPGAGQIALTWSRFSDALSGIDRYKLVYAIGAAPASCAKGKVVFEGGSTAKSFTHTGLINKTYGYRVCAIDKAGNVSTGAIWSGTPRP